MAEFKFGPTRVPVSEDELDEIQGDLGLSLDAEFRAFLVAHNDAAFSGDLAIRGRLLHDLVPARDQDRRRGLVASYRLMVDGWKCPRADLVPFAIDPGGYWFAVAAVGPESGSVWIFVTDTEEPRCEKLTDSFADFLNDIRQASS